MLQLKQELLRCNMAKDQLEGENVRRHIISTRHNHISLTRTRLTLIIYVLQEELKHKLSEGNKLITEYEVSLISLRLNTSQN